MTRLKTPQEIERLAVGGAKLAAILDTISRRIQPGVTPRQLDEAARILMKEEHVTPSFLGYRSGGHGPYPAALCVSVNEAVVHGIPDDRPLQAGDIVSIDAGLVYDGLFLDHARTVAVGEPTEQASRLLHVTRDALQQGIAAAKVGNTTGDIGYAVQRTIEAAGFGVVRALVGHGVGFAVHEPPQVPNFGNPGTGEKLAEGLVIAIEPMVVTGGDDVITADDGWTVITADNGLSAHEEHTVAVTAAGPRILTAQL